MYAIQLDAQAALGNVFSVGDAGLASVDGAGEAAAADHDATKPSFILANPAGSGFDVYLLNLALYQSGTVGGGRIETLCAYDAGLRYSSGGTNFTPTNRLAGGRGSGMSVKAAIVGTLLVASAASASVKYFDQRQFHYSVTAITDVQSQTYDFSGSVCIVPGWAFLFYCRAVTTAAAYHWNLDYYEKAV